MQKRSAWLSDHGFAQFHLFFFCQHGEMINKYTIAEKEITFLKIEISKLAKEKDEEKASRFELANEIEEWKKKEEDHLEIVQQHSQDLSEIKTLLVNCTQ